MKDLIEIWRDESLKLILPDHLLKVRWSADVQVFREFHEDIYHIKFWVPGAFIDNRTKSFYIPCKWKHKFYRVASKKMSRLKVYDDYYIDAIFDSDIVNDYWYSGCIEVEYNRDGYYFIKKRKFRSTLYIPFMKDYWRIHLEVAMDD